MAINIDADTITQALTAVIAIATAIDHFFFTKPAVAANTAASVASGIEDDAQSAAMDIGLAHAPGVVASTPPAQQVAALAAIISAHVDPKYKSIIDVGSMAASIALQAIQTHFTATKLGAAGAGAILSTVGGVGNVPQPDPAPAAAAAAAVPGA
jgi:hypothetical protein